MLAAQCVFGLSFTDSPGASAFNGTWRQQITPTAGKSRALKQLVIKTDANNLAVTMTGPGKLKTVDVTFQIGGPEVTYTGLDGDQFQLKVSLQGTDLLFEGREHEGGRVLPVREVWTLRTEGNNLLLIDSRSSKDTQEGATRTTIYEQVRLAKP
jgi:hypothetical protein